MRGLKKYLLPALTLVAGLVIGAMQADTIKATLGKIGIKL